ncbi:MAG: purine/pyrimidine permease [Lachnospiraceae bacterium]|nr:purine/pyrimidine permease [Lachnospiraceae bacterium]
MSKKERHYAKGTELHGIMRLREAIPLGLQHVLAMFAGNLTPILLIAPACGIEVGTILHVNLIQNAMFIAGIVTLIQTITIGPVGGKLPIVMGTSGGFIGVMYSITSSLGGGILAYGAILGASLIGGIFECVLGFFLKPIRKLFPSVVTGTVVLSIGLSLIGLGIDSICGGTGVADYGSLENLFVGITIIIVIVVLKHFTKGITSIASILISIIVGYILVIVMGSVLPKTIEVTSADGEVMTVTKSWVLQWDKVRDASIIAIPKFLPVKLVFDMRAIIPMIIMFIVTAVETIGDISAITEGGLDREATDSELSGGVICDGIGSSFAALFGVLPNTSYSENVGLVGLTKVVNLYAVSVGAVFLVLCGLFPKLAAVVSIIPQPVLGGACVLMFANIAVSGMKLIAKDGITNRDMTIVSVSLGLGYGLGSVGNSLSQLPQYVSLIFSGSGIVPAATLAIILNVVMPKEK